MERSGEPIGSTSHAARRIARSCYRLSRNDHPSFGSEGFIMAFHKLSAPATQLWRKSCAPRSPVQRA